MIPIYHLSSIARAGETLCLKLLSCHPDIHVPLQITADESPEAQDLLRWIRDFEPQELPLTHGYATYAKLNQHHLIVVKQGVWQPKEFRGFGLIRQPFAFVNSMLSKFPPTSLSQRMSTFS